MRNCETVPDCYNLAAIGAFITQVGAPVTIALILLLQVDRMHRQNQKMQFMMLENLQKITLHIDREEVKNAQNAKSASADSL